MTMSNEEILAPDTARPGRTSRAKFRGAEARGPVIDQEGREIPAESLGGQFQAFRFDFGSGAANPFGNLTREQRLARLDAIAKFSTSPSSCPAPRSVTASTALSD
jgi:hypothetical protein